MPGATDGLRMGDNALYSRFLVLEFCLDAIDDLVHRLDRLVSRQAAVVVHEEPLAVAPYTDIVDVADATLAGDELAQHGLDFLFAAVGEVLAGQDPLRQRFDMAFDLDILAEFAADGRLKNSRFLMRLFQCHLAVDLEIETDRRADADTLDGQVMDGVEQ
jgi:hypothetical protein